MDKTRANLSGKILADFIKCRVFWELNLMAYELKMQITQEPIRTIAQSFHEIIEQMIRLIECRAIDPRIRINTAEPVQDFDTGNRVYRIGIYPISGNPVHWGHLLIGLSAIASYQLDKVIYIVVGEDPLKDSLINEHMRHRMSQSVIKNFDPFLNYSPLARCTDLDGETNVFRILRLNPRQKIDAFYIAGADHYRRFQRDGQNKDTIQKIEDHIRWRLYNYNELMHTVSLLFVERQGGIGRLIRARVPVEIMPAIGFEASSTRIRGVFQGKEDPRWLATLPYNAYEIIRKHHLYSREHKKEAVINEGGTVHI